MTALSVSPSSPETSKAIRRMDELLTGQKPNAYALHDYIESVIGESLTKNQSSGLLRDIADAGHLDDFEQLVHRLNAVAADEVKDEDDLLIFTRLIEDARESIDVVRSVLQMPAKPKSNPLLTIAENRWNTEADLYKSLRRRA